MSLALRIVVGFFCIWCAWAYLVLKGVAEQTRPWGPRWFASALSGVLHNFGRWWLVYSDNAEEAFSSYLGDDKQHLVVWHPHGIYAVAALYFISHYWARHSKLYVIVLPLLLRIPLLAEFLLLCNARSTRWQTFDALFASGASVAVQPGGLREQVGTDEQQEQLFFPNRLGFLRMALKYGVPVVPTYAFGENQLYHTGPVTRAVNQWLYRTFHTGNFVVLGQGGIPWSPVLPSPIVMPVFRARMHIQFGTPVDLGPKDPDPSPERLREAFDIYVAALRKLFDEHKDKYLPPAVAARGLNIIWQPQGQKQEATAATETKAASGTAAQS